MNADDGAGQELRFHREEADGSNPRNLAVFGSQTSYILSGSVGIGTTNPTAALEVAASVQGLKVGVSGNMANANVEVVGELEVIGHDASSVSTVGASAWNFYNSGNNPSWSGTLLRYYGQNTTGTVNALPTANQGAIVFQNLSNGVITSNGETNIYIAPYEKVSASFLWNGNVGIGTTSPGSDVAMSGGVTINGSGATQLTVQQNGISGFALNVSDGAWTMYDKAGGTWNGSITSRNGQVSIGPVPVTWENKLNVVGSTAPGWGAIMAENTGGGGAIYAYCNSDSVAVGGQNTGSGTGIAASTRGQSTTSFGVLGYISTGPSGPPPVAVAGGVGVYGFNPTAGGVIGVTYGQGPVGNGVEGNHESGSAVGAGVWGRSNSPNGQGVYGDNTAGGYAGYFAGDVGITGTLAAGAKYFRIDHPLDPENKYLNHSAVESPDMMNVYNGNITTDNGGQAIVELPHYFEVLNGDFRYQLTTIGSFAQVMVEQEIEGGRFVIRTDKPNVKVSWQVTGIRKDPYAERHRIPIEEDKTQAERGRYLHPHLYMTNTDRVDANTPIGSIPGMFGGRGDSITAR
jgi:hypothetical protein